MSTEMLGVSLTIENQTCAQVTRDLIDRYSAPIPVYIPYEAAPEMFPGDPGIQRPEQWKEIIDKELDILLEEFPHSYRKLPQFFDAPTEMINGASFNYCFYGRVNDGDFNDASTQAYRMRRLIGGLIIDKMYGGTPLEEMTFLFFPARCHTYQGVTREMLIGWVREHYEAHKDMLAPELPPLKIMSQIGRMERAFRSLRHRPVDSHMVVYSERSGPQPWNIAPPLFPSPSSWVDRLPKEEEKELCPV